MNEGTAVLGDICDFIRGVAFDGNEAISSRREGYLPILRAGNIGATLDTVNDLVWVPSKKVSEEQYLRPGDIAICMSSGSSDVLGKTAQLKLPFRGSVGAFCGIIRARSDEDRAYIAYWLLSPRYLQWRDIQGRGANIQNLRFSELGKVRIPFPSPIERKGIAHILAKADRLRSLHHYALELSNTYLQSVFMKMFGDPITNPEGWDTIFLEKLAYGHNGIVDGPYGSSVNTEVDYVPEGEIPVIRTKNVGVFEFIEDDLKFITRKKFESLMRSRVVPGDIVLTKVGTIGQMCIFPNHFEEAVLSTTGSCKITPDTTKVDRIFLLHCLYAMREYMNQVASQAVQSFLNMTMVKEIPIILPPRPPQDRFALITYRFNRLRTQQYEAERQAEHLFQTLLHKAFRGELTGV